MPETSYLHLFIEVELGHQPLPHPQANPPPPATIILIVSGPLIMKGTGKRLLNYRLMRWTPDWSTFMTLLKKGPPAVMNWLPGYESFRNVKMNY